MEKTKWVKKNGEGEKEAAATWLRDNQRLRSRKGDRERRKRDLKRETKEDREKDSSLRERYRGEACPRPESLRIVRILSYAPRLSLGLSSPATSRPAMRAPPLPPGEGVTLGLSRTPGGIGTQATPNLLRGASGYPSRGADRREL